MAEVPAGVQESQSRPRRRRMCCGLRRQPSFLQQYLHKYSDGDLESTRSANIAKHGGQLDLQDDGKDESERSFPFLALPIEIRLMIYEHVLVASQHREQLPRIRLQEEIRLDHHNPHWRVHMGIAILRTCKQVYHEARPVLYSKNLFVGTRAEHLLNLRRICGRENFSMIRWVRVSVSHILRDRKDECVELFNILANEPADLRDLTVFWASPGMGYLQPRPGRRRTVDRTRGSGKDVEIARAIASIHSVTKLTLAGYYAQNWPEYFRASMGCEVLTPRDFSFMYPWGRPEERQIIVEKNSQTEEPTAAQKLKMYQEGTEDLWP